MNLDPVEEPTLFLDPPSTPKPAVTGRCSRCCTDMPMTALDLYLGYVMPKLPVYRCKNENACADRERKMFARQDDMAKRWAIA